MVSYRVIKTANKFHNIKSGQYASRKEARRAAELKMLQRAGIIKDLREQVRYELIPAQYDTDGRLMERSCSYIADFVYNDATTGQTTVEDTKGVRTPEYIIKRKLMLHKYTIAIKEI